MEHSFKLVLAYDGTDFHGWQRQAGVRTVQQELEATLQNLLGRPVEVLGASRTDAGVHARGQVASVRAACPIPPQRLAAVLTARLPPDVCVLHVCRTGLEFHPSRDARSKLYRYRIFNSRRPAIESAAAGRVWHVWHTLEIEAMRAAARELVGRHDFAAFANLGSLRQSTVRTIYGIGIHRRADEVIIDVEGDGFLYQQVRNMVGTLVEVGRGHWPPDQVRRILAGRDRSQAGPTAPPRGLCLQWVRYGPAGGSSDGI